MVARTDDVEERKEVGSLAGARKHGGGTALELADLRRHGVVRGVLQARVEIARLVEVEEPPHVLGRIVFPCRRLIDGDLARFRITGTIAALDAGGAEMLCHMKLLCTFVSMGAKRRWAPRIRS